MYVVKRYCYRNELEFGAAGTSCIIKDKCQAKPVESIVLLLNQLAAPVTMHRQ